MKKSLKICIWIVGIFAVLCIALMMICNHLVVNNAKGKAFSEIDSIRYNKVGLLLGTTPQARFDRITNYFFIYRIDAAEQLYKAGKIDQILISGDENSLDGVNETECMRDSLVERGVPENAIILDGKGYRTICSVINANKVYGLKSFTIISQKFHNERAIYQAEHLGLDVENIQAYNAKDPKSARAYLTTIREYFARVKMFIDLCFTDSEELYQQNTGKQGKLKATPCYRSGMKELIDSVKDMENRTDSFTVAYRQPIKGYKVKAVVKMDSYEINYANITFEKNGKSFTLKTSSFGDTLYNKGEWGLLGENQDIIVKNRNKVIEANYRLNLERGRDESPMLPWNPFFFKDLDFDGIDELVIVHYTRAVRNHSGFDIYRIVEGQPCLIDFPPYHSGVDVDYGMTDYPEFDYKKKTISCPYPEGELTWAGRTIYGVSKSRKDTVVVNGKKHFFNHMEVIKEIKFDKDE